MMYVQYPAMDLSERLQGLQVFSIPARLPENASSSEFDTLVSDFVIESTSVGVVLRAHFVDGRYRTFILNSSEWIDDWSDNALAATARQYASNRGWSESVRNVIIDRDQWTVQAGYDRHRPLHKFANDDGQEWYVSSRSGEVVQTTTARERLWNWLGSVTHWLYPTALRRHGKVWAQTVIWLTIFALFLTITGITIGVKQFRKRRMGGRSPYSGLALWHHYAGLVFGIFTLTWLISGMFSMNPWGTLETGSTVSERALLNGVNAPVVDVLAFVRSVGDSVPDGTVRLESSYWLGNGYVTTFDRDGRRLRIARGGLSGGIRESDIREASADLREAAPAQIKLITTGDDYYYNHHMRRELPVYRVTYSNGEVFYLSAYTGSLLRYVDSNARGYRWLFNALHTGDFSKFTRSRPAWDILILLLLAGVTTGVATGVYLAIKRVARQVFG
jgi:hypothetical protein